MIRSSAAILTIASLLPAQNTGATFVNGTDSYLDVPYSPQVVPTTGLTVEAWVTYDETTLGPSWRWPTIVRQNVNGGQESFFIRVEAAQNANTVIRFLVQTVNANLDVRWSFAPGQLTTWTHIAGTYDGTIARLIVNGQEVGNRAQTGILKNNGGTLRIGKGDDGGGNPIEVWNGEIDEVRLWPFARTAGEIQATMNMELQSVPGLVSTWNLNNDGLDSSSGLTATVNAVNFTPNTLQLVPYPVPGALTFGGSTPCTGASPITATVASVPTVGNGDFAIVCPNGPASGNGALITAFAQLQTPGKLLGVDIWPDLNVGGFVVSLQSGVLGAASVPLPIPNNTGLVNASMFHQFLWLDACGPQGITASEGLQVFILP